MVAPAMSLTELIGFAIGCMLVALGVASIAGWAIRRRAAERLLLLFGIWCLLYGLRLVPEQAAVRASIGISNRTAAYVIGFITYIINVPGGLFFEALLGPGWKQSIRRFWQLMAVYAAAAISIDLISARPHLAMGPNRPLVLAGLAVQALNVWIYRRRLSRLFTTPVIAAAGCALLFFVTNENLGRPLLPVVNLEPVGVLIFVAALSYGVAGSVFRVVPRLTTCLPHRLTEIAPRTTVRILDQEPAVGAVWLALAEARGGARIPQYKKDRRRASR